MTKPTAWPDTQTNQGTADENRQSLLAAAEHTRTLMDAMVRIAEDSPVAPELARRLESVLELLEEHILPNEVMIGTPMADRVGPRADGFRDRSPVSGKLNPMAPPVELTLGESHDARTTTTLGLAYQGPPGRVHGGWVATLLDHVMGYAAGTVDQWIFTRSLTVDYENATPLFEELEITARVDEIDGRKIWVVGEIRAGGAIVAKARGLWLSPRNVSSA